MSIRIGRESLPEVTVQSAAAMSDEGLRDAFEKYSHERRIVAMVACYRAVDGAGERAVEIAREAVRLDEAVTVILNARLDRRKAAA